MITEVKRVQLTCPKCKYEFKFNLGELDTEILELGRDINSILRQLAEYKTLSKEEQKERMNWKKQTEYALAKKREQLKNLKIRRKSVNDEVTRMNYHLLKNVIKEFYGNDEFERCINEVIERGKAYNISDTIGINNYTHSGGSVIKKV